VLHTDDDAYLCIDDTKVTRELVAHLAESGVQLRRYEDVISLIRATPSKTKIWLDASNANYALFQAATEVQGDGFDLGERVCEKMSPIQVPKAIKNDAEAQGREWSCIVLYLAPHTIPRIRALSYFQA